MQDSATAGIDNVTFVQCHPDVVPPGATGMARDLWAGRAGTGRTGPQPAARRGGCCSHRGCLVPVTLSSAQGQDHGAEAPGLGPSTHPALRKLHGVILGSGVGEQRERAILRICLLSECLIPSLWLRLPLSHQSCPATSRKACAAGTRIHPVTSNGCAAQGRGRAPTTPLARVRSWLPTRGPQVAPGTPQPPVPRARTFPAPSKQPHACGVSSAGAAQRHLDPGPGTAGGTGIHVPSTLTVPNTQATSWPWIPLRCGATGSGHSSSPTGRSPWPPRAASPSGTAWPARRLVHSPMAPSWEHPSLALLPWASGFPSGSGCCPMLPFPQGP